MESGVKVHFQKIGDRALLRIFFGLAQLFKDSSQNKTAATVPPCPLPQAQLTVQPAPVVQVPKEPNDLPLSSRENEILMFVCHHIGKHHHDHDIGEWTSELDISKNCSIIHRYGSYYDKHRKTLQVFTNINGEITNVSSTRGPWFAIIRDSIDELNQRAKQIQQEKRLADELKNQKEKNAEDEKIEKLRQAFAKSFQNQAFEEDGDD